MANYNISPPPPPEYAINGPFLPGRVATVLPQRKGKVLGASTVRRYTNPAPPSAAPAAPPGVNPAPGMNETPGDPVSVPTPSPYSDVPNPVDEYYKNLDVTPPTPEEQTAIREKTRAQYQAQIDAINAEYAGLIGQEQTAGEGRTGQTRAINARSGLIGSDFGVANAAETDKYNAQAEKALRDEQNVKVSQVNTQIDQRAQDEIQAAKATALGNAQKYVQRLQDNQQSAREDVKTIAKSGAKLDPNKLASLQKQTGYDPLTFESIYNANKPVPEYRAPVQLKDGTLIMTDTQGNIKNLGKYDLPDNFEFHFAPDGTPVVFNKDTGQSQVAANFHRGQFAKPPTASEKDNRTASEKEYEYAKGQGYAGSFLDYQKEAKAISSGSSNPFGG